MAYKPPENKRFFTIVFLLLIGAGIYGLNTGDLGWAAIIIGGVGLAILHK